MTADAPADGGLRGSIAERWTQTRGPLFTDMYELAMAQVYVTQGISERQAQFDYFFRSNPNYGTHQAGFCVSAGLRPFLDWFGSLEITPGHTDALAAMTSPTGRWRWPCRFSACTARRISRSLSARPMPCRPRSLTGVVSFVSRAPPTPQT